MNPLDLTILWIIICILPENIFKSLITATYAVYMVMVKSMQDAGFVQLLLKV